jgi:outer membrane protein OmpA-like peptidoglycan-associated protein
MNSGANDHTAYLRRFLFLSFICLGGLSLKAQVRLGIEGGLHSANILEHNSLPGWDSSTKPFMNPYSGFQLGFMLDIPLGTKGLYFQPAIHYSTKGRKYEKTFDSLKTLATDTIYYHRIVNLNYMEIPLLFTYKAPISRDRRNTFFISAGPYLSFVYNGKVTQESLTTDSANGYSSVTDPVTVGKGPDTYRTWDLGIYTKAGFELGNITISGYFSRGFTDFYTATYPGSFHHQVVGASVGIWFNGAKPPPAPPRKKDTDKDGIPDDQDLCPLQPGTAKWHGCPVPDSDHDGIDDEHDSCRNVPGVARYNGCPIPDSDHDGVNDEEDKCPLVPGPARYQGCPIPDRDGDGVNDEEDKCPDTPGVRENQGCPFVRPEIKKETIDKIDYIAHDIQFQPYSDRLSDASNSALRELAAMLLAHPEWSLSIEGYTDNSGKPEENLRISRKRAAAVRNYLIKQHVPPNRLKADGFGQARPIADNKTAKGRSTNRRVELKLSIDDKKI